MRFLRSFLFAIVLVSAFFYFTTYRSGRLNSPGWISHPQHVEITEAAASQAFDAEEQNNITVYRKNISSIVNITSRVMTFDFFYGLVPQEGQGSGFVIDKEGHILTNYHVIAEAREVWVTMHDRKKYKATIVGTDKSHDLAIVQIKAPDLHPMTLGDSANLQVGQNVYAIGNPFGLAGTLTRGIVSSIRQVQEPDGLVIDEAIQTDAAINPGNSGGPLLNWHGEVIGINTMIASNGVAQSAGIDFAIPINSEIAEELSLAADYGLLIVQAVSGGSADRAGLRGGTERAYLGNIPIMIGGDLIVAIDGEKVDSQQILAQIMNKHRAGDTVKVTIFRGKKQMEVSVVLGEARDQV